MVIGPDPQILCGTASTWQFYATVNQNLQKIINCFPDYSSLIFFIRDQCCGAGAGAGSRSRSRLDRHHNTVRDQVTMFSRYIWDVFHWGLFKTGLDTVGPQLQLVCRDDGFSPVSYHLFGKGEINLLQMFSVT